MDTEDPDNGEKSQQVREARKRKASSVSAATHKKFNRGPGVELNTVTDKKLKGTLKHRERVNTNALREAKKAYEWLRPADAGYLEAEDAEQTWQFKQRDIVQAVDEGAARKAFDLPLPGLGPYSVAFNRSGKWLAIGGRRGHLALMDWSRAYLACEVQTREVTRDVAVLHNEQFFAAAQRKHVYIYDRRGIEVHCCKEHAEPTVLDFLPHHFLLVSCGDSGVLRYQDTSHGEIVAQHRTRMGPVGVMRQNPWNAVMCVGHANGRVTMWTPNITTPVVSMQCHLGPLRALSVDPSGRYMATAGADRQVHIWDLRKSYERLHSYFAHAPPTSVDISQKGLLAWAYGSQVQVWRGALTAKAKACYMQHKLQGDAVQGIRFCPYEDVLAIGHAGGVSTMLVPGAGEPNFDSLVANPYQTVKERREQEVHQLLDKLQPDMIMLNPESVAAVLKVPKEVQKERALQEKAANAVRRKQQQKENDDKTKMKGKNRQSKKHRKKQDNIIEEKKGDVKERMRKQGVLATELQERKAKERAELAAKLESVPRALHRFHKRGGA